MKTRGTMQAPRGILCGLPMENIISTRPDMVFAQDQMWHFHETNHGIYSRPTRLNSLMMFGYRAPWLESMSCFYNAGMYNATR